MPLAPWGSGRRQGGPQGRSASRETCQRVNVTADGGFRNRLGAERAAPAGAPTHEWKDWPR